MAPGAADLELDLDPVTPPPPPEADVVIPDNAPLARTTRTEPPARAVPRTSALASQAVAIEPPPRPTFSIVLGSAAIATGGASSTGGAGNGAGPGSVPASASQAVPSDGDGDNILPDSGVSQHARMVSSVKPVYPAAALAQGIEVSVSCEIVVDREGNVTDARVVRGSGYGFEESALRSLRSARLSPAMHNGHPVRVRMPWIVDFRIE